MRVISGAWRGRTLVAPPGLATRPTAQRLRQAIFDMLVHAPWGGRALLDGAHVLDGFAGSGALGLEALSRGAASAVFIDSDATACSAIRQNLAACKASERARVVQADMRRLPPGQAQTIVFLDPPYGQALLPEAIGALRAAGWIGRGTVVVSESGRLEVAGSFGAMLAHRSHGAAQVNVWREV